MRKETNTSRVVEPLLPKICRLWTKGKGVQQTNALRLEVSNALDGDITIPDIAHEIRVKCFLRQPFDGVGRKDKLFEQIRGSLNRIKMRHDKGGMETLKSATGKHKCSLLKKRHVSSGTDAGKGSGRGRKVTDETKSLETELMEVLAKLWRADKRVT